MRYEPIDWYDNALYYDIVFDADTPQETQFLEDVFDRYGIKEGRRVLEPACGTGRLVTALAQRGYQVKGFDINPATLRFARRRLADHGVRARLFEASMQAFDLPPASIDCAHCLVSTFKYLLEEDDAQRHLALMARTLVPGGVYVLGLHVSEYDDRGCSRERWVASRDGIEVVCNIQGWPPERRTRRELIRSRLTVTEGDEVRRYETHWTFRTYSIRQLQMLLRSVPELEHVATFDFTYDLRFPIPFDGSRLDNVLVLRRR